MTKLGPLRDPSAILAFNDPWHDSSFCIYGPEIVRHMEIERITRRKYEFINPMLAFCDLHADDVSRYSTIAVQEGRVLAPALKRSILDPEGDVETRLKSFRLPICDPFLLPEVGAVPFNANSQTTMKLIRHFLRDDTDLVFCGHHAAHAANAFFSSGFDAALTVTLDGGGYDYVLNEYPWNTFSKSDLLEGRNIRTRQIYGSVFDCHGNHCKPIHQVTDLSFGWAWYRVLTQLLGFVDGEEGTVMAMAALGDPMRFRAHFDDPLVWLAADYELEDLTRKRLQSWLDAMRTGLRDDQDRYDVAAALQAATERRVKEFLGRFLGPRIKHLCLAGGTFLNCQITGKLTTWFPSLERIFVPPAPYDGGISIGAAQLVHHERRGSSIRLGRGGRAPFAMGQSYSRLEIIAAAREHGLASKPTGHADFLKLIASGKILGIFAGAAESGRRALGHRSIVADPRVESVRDAINSQIKCRQWFRPLAPMVLAEQASAWFECNEDFESPYMSFAIPVRPALRRQIPAVLHVDGTARLQTVHSELTPGLHRLLTAWHQLSGVPILVNTSFNDREPIVETPSEALRTLRRVPLHAVYFMDHELLVER